MSGQDRPDWTELDWAGPVSIENNFAEMADDKKSKAKMAAF